MRVSECVRMCTSVCLKACLCGCVTLVCPEQVGVGPPVPGTGQLLHRVASTWEGGGVGGERVVGPRGGERVC